MVKKTPCTRCGRLKINDSELCFKCNSDFQVFMKHYPISVEAIPHERMMEISTHRSLWEHNARWRAFLKTKPKLQV